jgi:hypothetical protein
MTKQKNIIESTDPTQKELVNKIIKKYDSKEKMYIIAFISSAKNTYYYHKDVEKVFDINKATHVPKYKVDIVLKKFKGVKTELIEVK